MAQLADPDADSALRAYLLVEAKSFRTLMVDTMLEDGAESAEYAWRARAWFGWSWPSTGWSGPIDDGDGTT